MKQHSKNAILKRNENITGLYIVHRFRHLSQNPKPLKKT
jgi:hypothetical protein